MFDKEAVLLRLISGHQVLNNKKEERRQFKWKDGAVLAVTGQPSKSSVETRTMFKMPLLQWSFVLGE